MHVNCVFSDADSVGSFRVRIMGSEMDQSRSHKIEGDSC